MIRLFNKARRSISYYMETRFPKPSEPRHVEVVNPADSRTLLTKDFVEAALSGRAHTGARPKAIV